MTSFSNRRSVLLGAAGMIALPSIARATRQDWDVPYVPTPPEVAEATRYRGIVAERAITSDPASRPAWSAERAE